jgi:hypothetical protein
MKCGYRGWIIDAMPDFSLGKFFAHARPVHASADEEVDGEMHIERDLSYFDTEDEAIQQWAFAWVSERDRGVGDRSVRRELPGRNSVRMRCHEAARTRMN